MINLNLTDTYICNVLSCPMEIEIFAVYYRVNNSVNVVICYLFMVLFARWSEKNLVMVPLFGRLDSDGDDNNNNNNKRIRVLHLKVYHQHRV